MSILNSDIPLPAPNYINPESRGTELIIAGTILLFTATVAVVLRCCARIPSRVLRLDDICIIVAWLFNVALTVSLNLASAEWGGNRHIWDIPPDWIHVTNRVHRQIVAGKLAYLSKLFYPIAGTFTRLSILFFYYRLIQDATWTRTFRWVLHATVASVLVLGTVIVFLAAFQCTPVEAYWVFPPIEGAYCRPETTELLVTSALLSALDAVVVALPIPVVWQLHMSTKMRLEVIALLTLGFIATAACCIRTYYVWVLVRKVLDATWYSYPVYMTSCIEINLGIICACIPHIRPLIKGYFQALKKSLRSSSGSLGDESSANPQIHLSV